MIIAQKKNANSFIDENKSKGEDKFVVALGSNGVWFYKIIKQIKTGWIDQGFRVTDILIREDQAVNVSLVKAHIPFKDEQGNSVMVSGEQITSLVKKFTDLKDEKMESVSVDFSIYVMGLGVYRINYSSDASGKGLSVRYLTSEIPTFEGVGYPSFYKNEIEKLISQVEIATPEGKLKRGVVRGGGLILHCGPTGSGKTTALAAEVGLFAEETTGTIITYENPIEYGHIATAAPVRQFELGRDITGETEDELRENINNHLLRNNPSVVMFGEARGKKDIRMMIDVGVKGHLALGTMHASNVKEALVTLASVTKGEEYLLAASIKAIVAHKLHINNKGVIVPLFEILIPSEQDRVHLANGDISKVVASLESTENGRHLTAISFENHIKELVKNGTITPQEAGGFNIGRKK
ncbi:MAG: Flp pilus assembly complex ATPase component TadA [Epsilonproteobacteria bacterium]|nr:Flp pilus assembly complex ATPase component TadA [Campylobacterota bacterium]